MRPGGGGWRACWGHALSKAAVEGVYGVDALAFARSFYRRPNRNIPY